MRLWKPLGRVQLRFTASRPDELWVADFAFVATWSRFVNVAFVIDAFPHRIVDWRVSRSMYAEFFLYAFEKSLHASSQRTRGNSVSLVEHATLQRRSR